MSRRESNPMWAPFEPAPLWRSASEIIDAYRAAEPRINRSQRYSLVVTEPLPDPLWSRP